MRITPITELSSLIPPCQFVLPFDSPSLPHFFAFLLALGLSYPQQVLFLLLKNIYRQLHQVDVSGMYSWTPLLMAVKGNYPAIVSLLLNHSPNVNAVDQEHWWT